MEVKEARAASGTREQSKYEVRSAAGGTRDEDNYEIRFTILKELVGKLNFSDFSVGVLRTDFCLLRGVLRTIIQKKYREKNVGFYSHT